MNDYKKLVEELRFAEQLGDSPPMNRFGVLLDKAIVKAAADTIEQLVKERDAAIENIPKSCSKCAHSQDGYARVLADGKTDGFCLTCVSNRRCNFEWRGVTE